jgi:hypothetical protein
MSLPDLEKKLSQLQAEAEKVKRELVQLQKRALPCNRIDTFVVTMLRYCSRNIPQLTEAWIASMMQPYYMNMFSSAFTTKAYNDLFLPQLAGKHNYEFLEYVGDRYFNVYLIKIMMRRFPQIIHSGGVDIIAKLIIEYGKGENLTMVAKNLNFGQFYRATDEEKQDKQNKILEDMFEAFVGALQMACRDNVNSKTFCEDIVLEFTSYAFSFIEDVRPLKYEFLTNPKTQLTNIFNQNRNRILSIVYHVEQKNKDGKEGMRERILYQATAICKFLDGSSLEIGQGIAGKKQESENIAARKGIEFLSKYHSINQIIPLNWIDFH